MSDKFTLTWETSDGYVGGSRPQRFRVNADDIEDDMTDKALENLAEEMAYEDFMQKVTSYVSDREKAAFVEWAKGVIANRAKEPHQ